ncbi:sulfotransferase-like domain-containing protein [Tateyamaria pelophila]|uniref:sulfotransferase-like domain-containing protein n=1 Tax=Tateyamaria pelophila TaxID=328415 RepID=UPI001CBD68B0|nr:HAD family hydrolase [Tateyamaria pelophila]
MTKRIAMWSGPRNLSTAMMYSFGARSDCRVVDEPFYAAYLTATGLDHPMRDDILGSQDTIYDNVVKSLDSPVSEPVFYQKHMTHHMLPDWPIDWTRHMTNVFLIRHPARVIASYAKKREGPTLEDIGFVQQARIFDMVDAPIVIDSADIRRDPAGMLQKLCARIGIDWDEKMLTWPKGGHAADGIWAAHWYGAVHRSTGFDAAEGPVPELSGTYAQIVSAALPHYEALAAHKIT